jgi:hypothetical protein
VVNRLHTRLLRTLLYTSSGGAVGVACALQDREIKWRGGRVGHQEWYDRGRHLCENSASQFQESNRIRKNISIINSQVNANDKWILNKVPCTHPPTALRHLTGAVTLTLLRRQVVTSP